MTKLQINSGAYNLKGTSYFKDQAGNEYSIDKANTIDLLTLLLEAVGMNITDRDNLLDKLEESED